MNVIVPITLTDAMLTSSDIAEPAAGETAWVSGASYTAGDVVARTTTHSLYVALSTHTGRTALPEEDAAYWKRLKPTLRWAAFDAYSNTKATRAGSFTYVLRPGFYNSMAFYGLEGATAALTVKDAPGGTVVVDETYDLIEPAIGEYEYLFSPYSFIDRLLVTDLLPYPDPEVTITVSAPAGTAAVGQIVMGDFRPLIGDAEWGGVLGGAQVEPVTYSYISREFDGTVNIQRRYSATDMRVRLAMPRRVADYAVATLKQVLDVPAAWIASRQAGFDGLNGFGIASGSVSYDNNGNASANLYVKGFI